MGIRSVAAAAAAVIMASVSMVQEPLWPARRDRLYRRRRSRFSSRAGYLRKTKGWTGGARYKGSAKAKRATRRGGNPASYGRART